MKQENNNLPANFNTHNSTIDYQDKDLKIQGSLHKDLQITSSEGIMNLQFDNENLINITIKDFLQINFNNNKLHGKSQIFQKNYLFDNDELIK